MRLRLPAVLLAVSATALSSLVLTGPFAAASAGDTPSPGSEPAAARALSRAERVAEDSGRAGRDLTTALATLRLSLDDLSTADRRRAETLLARPTDHPDPDGFGYTVAEAAPLCDASFCVHYVPTTGDAPPAADANANGVPDQVEGTLNLLEQVLAYETGLGYRPPPTDGTRGGDGRFDVYLSNIGAVGLYGFCAPETPVAGAKYRYNGYCVLDNDYVDFPGAPYNSLVVTAAHEFFHAIQFGYDASEDPWFLEATATWMEEQFADPINDNLQFVPAGQVRRNRIPLDYFAQGSGAHYGNWVFFQLMSERYGVDVVRDAWNRVDTAPGAPDDFSTQAIDRVLRDRGSSMATFYADFAAANTAPARYYSEGAGFGHAPVKKIALSKKKRKTSFATTLHHLTNRNVSYVPSRKLKRATLKLHFDLPSRSTGARAVVTTTAKDGSVTTKRVRLNGKGNGGLKVKFGSTRVRSVTVSLANASIRVRQCWQGTSFACQGTPKDDRLKFKLTTKLG